MIKIIMTSVEECLSFYIINNANFLSVMTIYFYVLLQRKNTIPPCYFLLHIYQTIQ